MMDFNERVIPKVTAGFQFNESLARYEFAKKYVGSNLNIIDIGCGTGYGSAVLGGKNTVVAIDNSKRAIAYANKHYSNKAKFLVASATKLPFKDNSFDVACSFEVIEHMKDVHGYLDEVYRILKPSGTYILSTPNKQVYSKGKKSGSIYHIKEYTLRDLSSLLAKYFKKIDIKGQTKNTRAKNALKKFMKSQKARKKLASCDMLKIRNIIPSALKEKLWKYLGGLYGRQGQEKLKTSDFPIRGGDLTNSEYFVAICKK